MELTDYMLWKALVLGVVVFIVGIWLGFTGRR